MQFKDSETEKNYWQHLLMRHQLEIVILFLLPKQKKKIFNKHLPSLSKLQTMKKSMLKDFLVSWRRRCWSYCQFPCRLNCQHSRKSWGSCNKGKSQVEHLVPRIFQGCRHRRFYGNCQGAYFELLSENW